MVGWLNTSSSVRTRPALTSESRSPAIVAAADRPDRVPSFNWRSWPSACSNRVAAGRTSSGVNDSAPVASSSETVIDRTCMVSPVRLFDSLGMVTVAPGPQAPAYGV